MTTQEKDSGKRTANVDRIDEQPEHDPFDIHNSSRWRFTIDRSNGQESKPKPSFMKRLTSFFKQRFD
jgi:hypothetical protein